MLRDIITDLISWVFWFIVVFLGVAIVKNGNQVLKTIETRLQEEAVLSEVQSFSMGATLDDRTLPPDDNDSSLIKNYIDKYLECALTEQDYANIPASITLGQGILESRYGTSKLAIENNNHFGIKCFLRSCKKGHCTNFTDDTHKDFFRKFPRPEDSFRAHSLLLKKPLYRKLFQTKEYKSWAYGLQACGYATDPQYAEKLIYIIERFQLQQYDK